MSVAPFVTSLVNPPVREKGAWYPEIVSWNTTGRCNLRCSHCYLKAGEPGLGELSREEGRQLIDQLVAAGTKLLILTGGEPLMRRDIVQLAAHASSKGLLVVLGTNGMLLSPRLVRELKEAGVAGAGISLDSLNPQKHDGFRGVPGAWKGAVRGIRKSVAQKLPVLVQMTVLPWNYSEVTDMISFAHREGATGFTLYFLVCTGRGEQLTDISPEQYEQALAALVEAQQQFPDMMIRARCAPQISRVAAHQGSALTGNAGCLAARQYCRVTPEGEVTPCPYLPVVAGSIRRQRFADIWQGSLALENLRTGTIRGRCGACDFREMCGGCRARAFALAGDVLAEDPWCAYQPSASTSPRADGPLTWTPEAEERLQRIPPFVRQRVKAAVGMYAAANHEQVVTLAVMTATLRSLGRTMPFRRPLGMQVTESAAPLEGWPSRPGT
ncbi:MAG: radical SAM protein [Chloroflexi bacterium]|nr:radical SAM protein [Chloroflexota bacterium]